MTLNKELSERIEALNADLTFIEAALSPYHGGTFGTVSSNDVREAWGLIKLAAQGQEWRPIGEAPRDGTHILVFDPLAEMSWQESPVSTVGWLAGEGWAVPGSEQDEQGGFHTVWEPTHWMPLPDPPQAEGEG